MGVRHEPVSEMKETSRVPDDFPLSRRIRFVLRQANDKEAPEQGRQGDVRR